MDADALHWPSWSSITSLRTTRGAGVDVSNRSRCQRAVNQRTNNVREPCKLRITSIRALRWLIGFSWPGDEYTICILFWTLSCISSGFGTLWRAQARIIRSFSGNYEPFIMDLSGWSVPVPDTTKSWIEVGLMGHNWKPFNHSYDIAQLST
jgi:hypothetical protein